MNAFELSLDQLEIFFTICQKENIQSLEARTALLHTMADKGLVKRMWKTSRTKEQFIKDMAKHYRVLHIKDKQEIK